MYFCVSNRDCKGKQLLKQIEKLFVFNDMLLIIFNLFFVLCLKWILWLCDLYLLQYYHFTWIKYLESAICTNFTNLHFFIYINKAYYYYEYWTISVEILIIFFLYIKIIMKTSGVLFPFPLFSTLKGYSFIVLALRKKRNLSP